MLAAMFVFNFTDFLAARNLGFDITTAEPVANHDGVMGQGAERPMAADLGFAAVRCKAAAIGPLQRPLPADVAITDLRQTLDSLFQRRKGARSIASSPVLLGGLSALGMNIIRVTYSLPAVLPS